MSVLNHSPAEIVRQFLIKKELGSDAGATWPVGYSVEPEAPDNVLTIYDKVGQQHGRTHDDGETQEHHGIQVRVRYGGSYHPGWLKAKNIHDTFDTDCWNETVTIGSDEYMIHGITNTSDVLSIGYEGTSRRRLFAVNALVSVTLLS